jgi:anthranilate/para-aminobenzoate synthase component I
MNNMTGYFSICQRTIVNRPLAGTIRRGKTKAEDKVLEQLLLSDEKQCAEHIMLVDLGRNDVGKVFLSPFHYLFSIQFNFMCIS